MVDFPNSVTLKAANAGHSRTTTATIGAISGASAADIATAIAATGVPILSTPPALLIDAPSYIGTLTPGVYTTASIISLIGAGATKLLSLSLTVATGTADFVQGGSIINLAAGSIMDKPYAPGNSIDNFSFTVDAASTVYVEARGA